MGYSKIQKKSMVWSKHGTRPANILLSVKLQNERTQNQRPKPVYYSSISELLRSKFKKF